MNERITDLHNQAIIFSHNNGGLRISSHIPNDYMKKFAELIVRECIHVALRDALPTWDNAVSEANVQCVKIAADLKEHFGVEE